VSACDTVAQGAEDQPVRNSRHAQDRLDVHISCANPHHASENGVRCGCTATDDEAERRSAVHLLAAIRLAAPELAPDDYFAALDARFDDGLTVMGADLFSRALHTSDRQVLDEAIGVLGSAVQATPPDSDFRHERLSNLGLAYQLRNERHGGDDDLRVAIKTGRLAVTTGGVGGAGCLANLADSVYSRFERASARQDLEVAVTLCAPIECGSNGRAPLPPQARMIQSRTRITTPSRDHISEPRG
jgi:hypothetical protein